MAELTLEENDEFAMELLGLKKDTHVKEVKAEIQKAIQAIDDFESRKVSKADKGLTGWHKKFAGMNYLDGVVFWNVIYRYSRDHKLGLHIT